MIEFKIYIESDGKLPLMEGGMDVFLATRYHANIIMFEDIEEVVAHPNHMVVACIETTNAYLQRLGIEPKKPINIPDEISSYAKRDHKIITVKEFLETDYNRPIFIKPQDKAKQFVAGVLSTHHNKQYAGLNDLPPDTKVMISEYIDLITEYRGYVIEGELVGLYNYLGDFCVFPDTDIIKSAIKDFKSAPAGYSIDFGVTKSGETVLIECNDGWSLGNYGLNKNIYFKLLRTRWKELMKNRKQ